MSETDNQLAITANHYRQLDFLRLFRLARGLELVKRKRKMPVNYDSDSNARSACRRLLRAVIKQLFNDCTMTSNWNHYFVVLPQEQRNALTYFIRNIGYLTRSDIREVRDAVASYEEIAEHIDGFIYPALPSQIKVRLSSASHTRRNRNSIQAIKPAENFYRCAVACIRYKAIWNTHIDSIIKVAESEQAKANVAAKKTKDKNIPRRASRNRTHAAMENTATFVEEITHEFELPTFNRVRNEEIVREAVALSENNVERVREAQNTFDQALSEFLHRGE